MDDGDVKMSDVQKAASAPPIQFELVQITLRRESEHGSILQVRPIEQ